MSIWIYTLINLIQVYVYVQNLTRCRWFGFSDIYFFWVKGVGVWNSINENLSVMPAPAGWVSGVYTALCSEEWAEEPGARRLGHWRQLPPPPLDTPAPALEELGERRHQQQKFASFYRAWDVLPPVGLGSSCRPELGRKWEWSVLGNINKQHSSRISMTLSCSKLNQLKCCSVF